MLVFGTLKIYEIFLLRKFWANERPTSTEYDSETESSLSPETATSVRPSLSGPTRRRHDDRLENSLQNLEQSNNDLKSENRQLKFENEVLWIGFVFVVLSISMFFQGKPSEIRLNNCKFNSFLNELFIF